MTAPCPVCAAPAAPGDRFCRDCGASLLATATRPMSSPPDDPPIVPLVVDRPAADAPVVPREVARKPPPPVTTPVVPLVLDGTPHPAAWTAADDPIVPLAYEAVKYPWSYRLRRRWRRTLRHLRRRSAS
jgi:hypothetical protein